MAGQPTQHRSLHAEQARILVVEDHLETRTFLELVLQEDFQLQTADSASQALEKTSACGYDLLLVDIALGEDIDGVELVKRLRQMPKFSATPMIAMTAHQLYEDGNFYLDRGFDEYLSKPFFPEDLLATIDRLLSK